MEAVAKVQTIFLTTTQMLKVTTTNIPAAIVTIPTTPTKISIIVGIQTMRQS
jgi:hypothetical protein